MKEKDIEIFKVFEIADRSEKENREYCVVFSKDKTFVLRGEKDYIPFLQEYFSKGLAVHTHPRLREAQLSYSDIEFMICHKISSFGVATTQEIKLFYLPNLEEWHKEWVKTDETRRLSISERARQNLITVYHFIRDIEAERNRRLFSFIFDER